MPLTGVLANGLLALLATGWVLAQLKRQRGTRSRFLGPLLVCACCVLVGASSELRVSPRLEVVALDVGQGDAILVRTRQHTLLVDGGGGRSGIGARVLIPALAALGVHRLDVAVLSHGDEDHCGGLLELERYLPISELWVGQLSGAGPTDCRRELEDAFQERTVGGARVRSFRGGEVVRLGELRLAALRASGASRNASSLVLRLLSGSRSVLLMGDLEARNELELLRAHDLLRADVLKVAHHGSSSSSAQAFLDTVKPSVSVLSAVSAAALDILMKLCSGVSRFRAGLHLALTSGVPSGWS